MATIREIEKLTNDRLMNRSIGQKTFLRVDQHHRLNIARALIVLQSKEDTRPRLLAGSPAHKVRGWV